MYSFPHHSPLFGVPCCGCRAGQDRHDHHPVHQAGYLGEDIRDGFKLAIAMEEGKLGGIPVELLVDDDGMKPKKGRQIADRFIRRDKVQILTGLVFSNVVMAVVPKVVRQGIFYLSPNAGPSRLAGRQCQENFFSVSWQNDNLSEAVGQYATDQGFDRVYLIAPNYLAGKDNIAGEVYTSLGQADYAAELAALRVARPDAVYFFLPDGMGINFLKQYAQAGLNSSIPLLGSAATDERLLQAVGRAALEKADFTSVRGNFRFGNNHFPIQDYYVRQVVESKEGSYSNRLVGRVFTDHQDAYAGECRR